LNRECKDKETPDYPTPYNPWLKEGVKKGDTGDLVEYNGVDFPHLLFRLFTSLQPSGQIV